MIGIFVKYGICAQIALSLASKDVALMECKLVLALVLAEVIHLWRQEVMMNASQCGIFEVFRIKITMHCMKFRPEITLLTLEELFGIKRAILYLFQRTAHMWRLGGKYYGLNHEQTSSAYDWDDDSNEDWP